MKLLAIVAVIVVLAACGGGASPKSATPATATIPAALNPSSGAAMASLWCPATNAAYLADCKAAVEAAVGVSLPSAVCAFNDGKWAITTPNKGDTPGSACGAGGAGTIRGIIVAP